MDIHNKIVEFLKSLPNMVDAHNQQALIYRAGLDQQLQDQITFGGSAEQFFQLLVSTLSSYGTLEDGRDALEAVLEAAKSYVGGDRRRDCENLIQEWHRFRSHSTEKQKLASHKLHNTFVPDYHYDIAVSYAPIDDQPAYGEEGGWVTGLIKALKIQLAQKLGSAEAFSLWSDHQLAGNVPISSMLDIFRRSATLLVVLSPGYLMSEWCQRQQNSFLNVVTDRIRSGSRVFVVERDLIDLAERPSEFGDLRGYQFWTRTLEGKPPRTLTPNRDPREYQDVLNELSYDIMQELRKLQTS